MHLCLYFIHLFNTYYSGIELISHFIQLHSYANSYLKTFLKFYTKEEFSSPFTTWFCIIFRITWHAMYLFPCLLSVFFLLEHKLPETMTFICIVQCCISKALNNVYGRSSLYICIMAD